METPEYSKYMKERQEANPFFLKVFETMTASGELEGLDDDTALEKVVEKAEKMKENEWLE